MEESDRRLMLRFYSGICLELRKITKILSKDNRSPGRDLNPDLHNTNHSNTTLVRRFLNYIGYTVQNCMRVVHNVQGSGGDLL
jgi:hypothetical protein